jgi:phage terminase Nu1 subunit (DNA packaging protein)
MPEEYLTVKDLRMMFAVSDGTVRNWVKDGMPCLRFGNQILRFREAQVKLWLAEHKMIVKHPLSADKE